MNLLGSQPERNPGSIDGGIASAQDDNLALDLGDSAEVYLGEPGGTLVEVFIAAFPGNIESHPLVGASSNIDRLKALAEKVIDAPVFADRGISLDLYTKALDILNLGIQHISGEAIFRDTDCQPSSGYREGLKDSWLVTIEC